MAHSVERLEQRLEVQDYKLNALLDVTQGINARATEAELLEQYRVTLAENLGIHRLVLYANDDGWKCLLTNGVAGEIPAVLEASFFDKGGQVRLHSSQGNEDFDVVIPVLHNGAPIAYLLAGTRTSSTLSLRVSTPMTPAAAPGSMTSPCLRRPASECSS